MSLPAGIHRLCQRLYRLQKSRCGVTSPAYSGCIIPLPAPVAAIPSPQGRLRSELERAPSQPMLIAGEPIAQLGESLAHAKARDRIGEHEEEPGSPKHEQQECQLDRKSVV